MSKPTGASRHSENPSPSLAPVHARVFEAAVHAGSRAGRKAAKRQLKRAAKRGGHKLPKHLRREVLKEAERAAGRAAYAAASKALRKHAKYSMATEPPEIGAAMESVDELVDDIAVRHPGSRPSPTHGSQVVLEVLRVEPLSPHMVRIIAGGQEFSRFASNGAADQHVKLHFANPALGLVPPYDMRQLRKSLAREDQPVSRTYTVRWHDPVSRELAIDFVLHGDEGIAGDWAARAKPGDPVVMSKSSGKFRPDPSADRHIYAGDETALPAISSALEMLPGHAAGHVFIEVDSASDRQELTHPPGVEVTWLYRGGAPAGTGSLLLDALRTLRVRGGRVDVLAHGERTAMHEIRRLISRWDIDKRRVQVSSYWTAGRAKRKFRPVPAPGPVLAAM